MSHDDAGEANLWSAVGEFVARWAHGCHWMTVSGVLLVSLDDAGRLGFVDPQGYRFYECRALLVELWGSREFGLGGGP